MIILTVVSGNDIESYNILIVLHCNFVFTNVQLQIEIHNVQFWIKITFKYTLMFISIKQYTNHFNKNRMMKLHMKTHLSPTYVGQKHSEVHLKAFNITWNYNNFHLNVDNIQLSDQKHHI